MPQAAKFTPIGVAAPAAGGGLSGQRERSKSHLAHATGAFFLTHFRVPLFGLIIIARKRRLN